jgi:hypothetical protein
MRAVAVISSNQSAIGGGKYVAGAAAAVAFGRVSWYAR